MALSALYVTTMLPGQVRSASQIRTGGLLGGWEGCAMVCGPREEGNLRLRARAADAGLGHPASNRASGGSIILLGKYKSKKIHCFRRLGELGF